MEDPWIISRVPGLRCGKVFEVGKVHDVIPSHRRHHMTSTVPSTDSLLSTGEPRKHD